MDNTFKDKNILVTGGAGTIGTEIVKQLLTFDIESVRVLDNRELGLYELQKEIDDTHTRVRYLLGDIRDKDRLIRATENIDIIFHAAALKQVIYCERNPFEAVRTNIIGTQNVIDAALYRDVEKVIGISTDKAVNPVSTMGASKLIAERLILDANLYKGDANTTFSCIRFGNVLFASASIIPLFKERIKQKKSLEVRHPEMTRFIMPLDEAIGLVFKSASLTNGGEIFILKMPSVRILDLTDAIIKEYSDNPSDVVVRITKPNRGEKIHEDLMTSYESINTYEDDELLVIKNDDLLVTRPPNVLKEFKKTQLKCYTSDTGDYLSSSEIKELLKKYE